MPHYDFCCIATSAASSQRLTTLVRRVALELQKRGGVVRKVEHYGLRPLAYPIKAHSRNHEVGRYFRIQVQASPVTADLISDAIKNDESIIRHRHFVGPTIDTRAAASVPLKHLPDLSEAHYDALRRTTNIDYFVARTLLKLGKITPDEIVALGTHTPAMTPAAPPQHAVPAILPRPLPAASGPLSTELLRERRDTLSMDIPGVAAVDEADLPSDDPLKSLLDALRPEGPAPVVAVPRAEAALPTALADELARAQAAHSEAVLAHMATRTELAVDIAASAQRSEGNMQRAAAYFAENSGKGYSPLADLDKQQ